LEVGPRGATQAVRPPKIAIGDAQVDPPPVLRGFTFPASQLDCSAFAPDGRSCAFAGNSTEINIIDVTNGTKLRALQQGSGVSGLAFTQDGRTLIAGSYSKGVLFSWDLSKNQATQLLADRPNSPLTRALFAPDGLLVLCQHADGNVRLWDRGTGRLLRTILSPSTTTLDFSPEGHRILMASNALPGNAELERASRGSLRLLDVAADRTLWSLDLPQGPAGVACRFLPDGSRLVVFYSDGMVVWHDASDGRELRRLKLAASPRSDVAALTRDGLRAVTGLDDQTVRLWDLADGRELSRVSLPVLPFGRPTFSPDGTLVALGGDNGQCHLWRLPAPVARPSGGRSDPVDAPLVRSLDGTIADLAIGGGGRYLLLILKDRLQMAIFDVNVADVVKRVPLASTEVLVTAGADKAVLVYPTLGFIHRFNLNSGELDKSVEWPLPGPALAVGMGYDSAGPLLVAWTGIDAENRIRSRKFNYAPGGGVLIGITTDAESAPQVNFFSLLDLETLAAAPVDSVPDFVSNRTYRCSQSGVFKLLGFLQTHSDVSLRASAGGDVFSLWQPNASPSGFQTVTLRDSSLSTAYRREDSGFAAASVDGAIVLTESGELRDGHGKLLKPGTQPAAQAFVPAIGAPLYLGIQGLPPRIGLGRNRAVTALVHLAYGSKGEFAIARLDELDRSDDRPGPHPGNPLAPDKRLIWIPAADLLITIPFSDERLVLRRLNLREAVNRLKIDGVFLTSSALLTARAGTPFRSRIDCVSREKDVTFELIHGPNGLSVARDGTISWEPPAALAGHEESVVVAVSSDSTTRANFGLRLRVQ
jgi:WD40 repeat protein